VTSERARLTMIYGGLMVLAGVLLTGLVYVLVGNGLTATIDLAVTRAVPAERIDGGPTSPIAEQGQTAPLSPAGRTEANSEAIALLATASTAVEDATLRRLLTLTSVSLVPYAIVSAALAWWMAGWILRPVRVITIRARRLSASNLHERLTLRGPPGELKELADTFDEMLDRIEGLVAAQQRFAANAAHQLRTPVAIQRAAAEIGLGGAPSPEKVARIRRKLIENADESQRLIDGLLLLAGSEQGIEQPVPIALDEIARSVVEALESEGRARRINLEIMTEPAMIEGDAVLLGHLAHNLIFNALVHNHPTGTVLVRAGSHHLEVVNTGPIVAAETVPLLFEPFRRTRVRTYVPGEGAGLGLSIVASIARAHRAQTVATTNPDGGLTVKVLFPTCTSTT
jgi:signal transduction histidine kinase